MNLLDSRDVIIVGVGVSNIFTNFIARRYVQNMMYQTIYATYLVIEVLSLNEDASEWSQGNHWPLPMKKSQRLGRI